MANTNVPNDSYLQYYYSQQLSNCITSFVAM